MVYKTNWIGRKVHESCVILQDQRIHEQLQAELFCLRGCCANVLPEKCQASSNIRGKLVNGRFRRILMNFRELL